MKRIKNTLIFCFISFIIFPVNSQTDKLTRNTAYNLVLKNVLNSNINNINVLVAKNTCFKGDKIEKINKEIVSVPFQECWFFFIDDHPFANWSHPCRFVFVNIYTGDIKIVNEKNPPANLEDMDILKAVEVQINKANLFNPQNYTTRMFTNNNDPSNNYAVIISGGADAYNNWVRYWNDCASIYTSLVNVYGYLDSHIYVLISDGTNPGNDRHLYDWSYDSSPLDLDGDGDNDIGYSATKSNITSVFNTLSGMLTQDDFLFIFTTDHGGQESGQDVYINLWNETMKDDEFATEVNKVNAGEINVVMEQCHSGGFVDDLAATDRVIATACRYDESSWAMPPDYTYNEFVFHWTAAVTGQEPDGTPVDADTDNDGNVTMQEAFNYAEAHDTQSEYPQYDSQPSGLGSNLTLDGLICPEYLTLTTNISGGTHGYLASNSITATNIISGGANVHYGANTRVKLSAGFRVYAGSYFLADLDGCTSALKSTKVNDNIITYNQDNLADNLNDKGKIIDIENPGIINDVKIFPNPTKAMINIEFNKTLDQEVGIQIVNIGGVIIKSISTSENKVSFDINDFNSGIYIVKIISNNNVMIKRIIKQ